MHATQYIMLYEVEHKYTISYAHVFVVVLLQRCMHRLLHMYFSVYTLPVVSWKVIDLASALLILRVRYCMLVPS